MTRRTRHPLHTILLLVAFAGVAWFVVENEATVTGWLGWDREVVKPDAALLESIADGIEVEFKDDPCLLGLQSQLIWRASENRFRINIDMDPACIAEANDLCARIAGYIKAKGKYPASVWAYNGAGESIGHFID